MIRKVNIPANEIMDSINAPAPAWNSLDPTFKYVVMPMMSVAMDEPGTTVTLQCSDGEIEFCYRKKERNEQSAIQIRQIKQITFEDEVIEAKERGWSIGRIGTGARCVYRYIQTSMTNDSFNGKRLMQIIRMDKGWTYRLCLDFDDTMVDFHHHDYEEGVSLNKAMAELVRTANNRYGRYGPGGQGGWE